MVSHSTPPTEDSNDVEDVRSRHALQITRSQVFGGIVVAIIGVVGALGAAYFNKNDQTSKDPLTPTRSPAQTAILEPSQSPTEAQPQVSITEPAITAILVMPGKDVDFAGAVTDLPSGDVLWLVSRQDNTEATYYIGTSSPVATGNGPWSAKVHKLGSPSDHGKSRTFFLVDADGECSKEFLAVKNKHPRKLDILPPACKILAPTISVTFQ